MFFGDMIKMFLGRGPGAGAGGLPQMQGRDPFGASGIFSQMTPAQQAQMMAKTQGLGQPAAAPQAAPAAPEPMMPPQAGAAPPQTPGVMDAMRQAQGQGADKDGLTPAQKAALYGSVQNPGEKEAPPQPGTPMLPQGRNISPEAMQQIFQAMLMGTTQRPQMRSLGQIFSGR